MCARPPLVDIAGTAGEPEAENRDKATGLDDSECFYLPPLARAQTLDSSNHNARQVPISVAQLRSVKSGPTHARSHSFGLCSSGDEAGSRLSDMPSLREQSCSPSECKSSTGCASSADCKSSSTSASSARSCGSGCGCGPSSESKSCSKGDTGCRGTGACEGSETRHAEDVGTENQEPPSTAAPSNGAGSVDLENLGRQHSSRPRPGVARVTVRKGVNRKRPAVEGESSDPVKPTFGDLEDLWRKDSEARNYCSFVCSAPAMCRGGQDGLLDPLPGLTIDFSRRKRLKGVEDVEHSQKGNAAALALSA